MNKEEFLDNLHDLGVFEKLTSVCVETKSYFRVLEEDGYGDDSSMHDPRTIFILFKNIKNSKNDEDIERIIKKETIYFDGKVDFYCKPTLSDYDNTLDILMFDEQLSNFDEFKHNLINDEEDKTTML